MQFHRDIGHQRADHRSAQAAAGLPVIGQHVNQCVAVMQGTVGIHHLHAVAVAVESDAEIGTGFAHEGL